MAVFVWTFNGVMEAIGLGLMVITFAVIGLLLAWMRLMQWWNGRRKGK